MDFPSLHIFSLYVLWEFLEKMTERKKSDDFLIPRLHFFIENYTLLHFFEYKCNLCK